MQLQSSDDDNDDFYAHLGSVLPWCPSSSSFPYPNVVTIYGCLTLFSLFFALIAGIKYNSVKVFNRSIRTENISNTMWIIFYVFVSLRSATNAIRYALDKSDEQTLDSYFFFSTIILHGLTAFALSLALNHQRRYRSTAPTPIPQNNPPAEPNTGSKFSFLIRYITWLEVLFFVLFIIFLAFLFVMIAKRNDSDSTTWLIVFLVVLGMQRVPIVALAMYIVFQRGTTPDGPTKRTKLYLILATLLYAFNDFPMNVWAGILPSDCYFYIGSVVDVFHLFIFASLFFYFMFLRAEYLRNMEECIWTTVSQVQDTFDFRRF